MDSATNTTTNTAINASSSTDTSTNASTLLPAPAPCAGRPADTANRLQKELAAYDLLDGLGIPYLRLDHEATATIEACHDIDKRLGIEICKNLFLCNAQKTDFYLLMMPGHKKFKTARLSKQIGSSRLSFAGPEYMEEFLNITPGSVSILGLMNDEDLRVRLLIDRDVIDHHEFIGCHPCVNTSSLKIRTQDILEIFLPFVNHTYTVVELPWEE